MAYGRAKKVAKIKEKRPILYPKVIPMINDNLISPPPNASLLNKNDPNFPIRKNVPNIIRPWNKLSNEGKKPFVSQEIRKINTMLIKRGESKIIMYFISLIKMMVTKLDKIMLIKNEDWKPNFT